MCLEMAYGEPPYMDHPPLTALRLILIDGIPALDDSFWSELFIDFVDSCLQIVPDKRLSCTELINHQFMKSACDKAQIKKVIRKAKGEKRKEKESLGALLDDI